MGLIDTFRSEVEAFLVSSGESATKFGADAVGDPSFVFDLRTGRAPRADTIDRVREFISRRPQARRTSA